MVIEVTVANVGDAPTARGFWVDLYIEPDTVPEQVNQIWPFQCSADATSDEPCSYGIAWEVAQVLAAGETLTLRSDALADGERYSRWGGWLPSGTTRLYAFVDSWNPDDATNGAVNETNETNNRAVLTGLSVTGDNPPLSQTELDERP